MGIVEVPACNLSLALQSPHARKRMHATHTHVTTHRGLHGVGDQVDEDNINPLAQQQLFVVLYSEGMPGATVILAAVRFLENRECNSRRRSVPDDKSVKR